MSTPNPADLLHSMNWRHWMPLSECWKGDAVPASPGLYKIRRQNRIDLDYIGQTGSGGMTLRRRLSMLKGIYGEVMPYRAPHTAGPALWALLKSDSSPFEVSVLTVEGSTSWRKGLEALAISLYRQENGKSPTCNFGRMPVGFRMSSDNNSRLVSAGKRFRGGLCEESDSSHLESLPPVGPLSGHSHSSNWCGHQWFGWTPLRSAVNRLPKGPLGLYRIRHTMREGLFYVGQGVVRDRLTSHAQSFPAVAELLECSWVLCDDWHSHQRLELENDLIAGHVLTVEKPPEMQFLNQVGG